MPDNNSILEKLEGLVSRYEEVSTLITDPSVIADQERFVRLTREYKDLDDIMKARKKYIACLNAIKEAKDILANENDPDLKDMAKEELQINEDLQPQIEEEIKIALVPKDPEDAKNVQMEIRAGTGGDEAALFAGDLFQMYKVFNMGHRMEIYVRPEVAEQVMAISKSFNIDAQIIGHIEEGKKSLLIKSEYGEFEY